MTLPPAASKARLNESRMSRPGGKSVKPTTAVLAFRIFAVASPMP
jgi:hypothetical protein